MVKLSSASKGIQTEELECLINVNLMSPQLKGKQMVSGTGTLVSGLVYSEIGLPQLVFNCRMRKGRRPFPEHAETQTDNSSLTNEHFRQNVVCYEQAIQTDFWEPKAQDGVLENGDNVITINLEDISLVDVDPIVRAEKEVQTSPLTMANLLDYLVERNFDKEQLLVEKDYRVPEWGSKVLVEDLVTFQGAHLVFWDLQEIQGENTILCFLHDFDLLHDSLKWRYQVHRDYLNKPGVSHVEHFLFDPVKGDKSWAKLHRPKDRALVVCSGVLSHLEEVCQGVYLTCEANSVVRHVYLHDICHSFVLCCLDQNRKWYLGHVFVHPMIGCNYTPCCLIVYHFVDHA